MRVAIYARVSTDKQDYAMQLVDLRQRAKAMGWEPVEYLEKASSVKKRPEFDRLMADARQRKFDVVLVWRLDRWARSMSQLINTLQDLDRVGIRFVSHMDNQDTDRKSPTGTLLMQILGAFAEFERNIIVERVRAGVAEAKRQGKHCGRPRATFRRDQAAELRAQGLSWRTIAGRLGVPVMTVRDGVMGVRKVL